LDLEDNYVSHWVDGLAFLSHLKYKPPPFRQPLTTKIRWRLEEQLEQLEQLLFSFSSSLREKPAQPPTNIKLSRDCVRV
jgi:hypothetical protein